MSKALITAAFLLLTVLSGASRAEEMTGCPAGFLPGGGGECYWTQDVTASPVGPAGIVWSGLTWNNYDLYCYGVFVSTSGTNLISLTFAPDGTFDTSNSYEWRAVYGSSTGTGQSAGTTAGFAVMNFVGVTAQASWMTIHMGSLGKANRTKGFSGTVGVYNGSDFFAVAISGQYSGSMDPITAIKVAPNTGTMGADCTLYARPGG